MYEIIMIALMSIGMFFIVLGISKMIDELHNPYVVSNMGWDILKFGVLIYTIAISTLAILSKLP